MIGEIMTLNEIEQTPEGYWVIKGESHLNGWVRQSKRLDHDTGFIGEICGHIKPGSIVIDVGANIGDHTIAYIQAVGPFGTVVAYEPHPLAFCCLHRNCRSSINVQAALGNSLGNVAFLRNETNVGASYISDYGATTVALTTMDREMERLFNGIPTNVSLIKIDVEGHELEVLKGGRNTILSHKPVIVAELNKGALERAGTSQQEVFDYIQELGYQIYFRGGMIGSAQPDVFCFPY